jgi:hypothetical protein
MGNEKGMKEVPVMFTRNPIFPLFGEIAVNTGHPGSAPGYVPLVLPASVPFIEPHICSIL